MPRRWIAEARPDSFQDQQAREKTLGCSQPWRVHTCRVATILQERSTTTWDSISVGHRMRVECHGEKGEAGLYVSLRLNISRAHSLVACVQSSVRNSWCVSMCVSVVTCSTLAAC